MIQPFIEIDAENFSLSAYKVKPIEGYEVPVNDKTGEALPNCCNFHKDVFKATEEWFEKFPNCCDPHRAMVTKWWYNKANYAEIAEKVVIQLSYTEHHILNRISNEDWYKDITDYIEYNVMSFGQPAIGLHLYLNYLKHYISLPDIEISKIKKERLTDFIDTYFQKPADNNKVDLNILISTYQKWLKIFPFDISFFAGLKPAFEKQLPILTGQPETNKYTGLTKSKMHTKGSLIDVLLSLTKKLLNEVNIPELRKRGAITNVQANQLEIAEAELNTKAAEITMQFSKGELKYIKALKKWLELHKNYFKEVSPLLKALFSEYVETPESVEKDFTTEYRKMQQIGNTSISLLKDFENDKPFIAAFQNEFAAAPLFADVTKYWRLFYNDEQMEAGFVQVDRGIPIKIYPDSAADLVQRTSFENHLNDLKNEFYQLVTGGKAPKSCYTHNIHETNIYKQFKSIEGEFKGFKEMKNFDYLTNSLLMQAEQFGQGIISEIEKINYEPIRGKVITTIINDTDNIYTYLPKIVDSITKNSNDFNEKDFAANYSKAKMYLNNYLQKHLSVEEAKANNNQQPKSNAKQEAKPTITAYAIMHVYLAMYGGQAITQQNKNELAKTYGYNSGEQLRNDYTLHQNEDKRLDLHTTNKRSANTHLKRFKDILPLLEGVNKQAFNKANEDFQSLQKTYNKHY